MLPHLLNGCLHGGERVRPDLVPQRPFHVAGSFGHYDGGPKCATGEGLHHKALPRAPLAAEWR